MTTGEPIDEAWALNMVMSIRQGALEAGQRRDELATAIDELANGLAKLGTESWKTGMRSVAKQDRRAPSVRLGDRTESVERLLKYEAAVNVLSAADQLRGYAVLLRAEVSLMGAVSVARGVFEACLWATSVIDPTISTDDRLQRALNRRLARLSAGVRLADLLSAGVTTADVPIQASNEPDPPGDDDDDEHGSNRDPAEDIKDIVVYAESRNWNVKKRQRALVIEDGLSIDWLTANLEGRLGIEGYAWTSGSSMSHGEHAADTASWVALTHEIGSAPAWLMNMWSTGVWAGPRLFLATFARYTGRIALGKEYQRFERAYHDVGIKGGKSDPARS